MTSISIGKTKSWDQFIISDNCFQRFSPNCCCSLWPAPAVSLQGCHWWVVVSLWISPQSFQMCGGYFMGGLGLRSALHHKMACVTEYQESWGGHQHRQCLWVRLSAQGLIWLTESETESVFMWQDRNRKAWQRGHATHDWEGFPQTTVVWFFPGEIRANTSSLKQSRNGLLYLGMFLSERQRKITVFPLETH